MRLDAADVLEVAARARLRVAAADAPRLATELGRALAWADALLPPLDDERAGADSGSREGAPPVVPASTAPVVPASTAPVAPASAARVLPGAPDARPLAEATPPARPLRPDVVVPSPGPDLLAESAGRDGTLVRVPPVR